MKDPIKVRTSLHRNISSFRMNFKEVLPAFAIQTLEMPGTGERGDGRHRRLVQGKCF